MRREIKTWSITDGHSYSKRALVPMLLVYYRRFFSCTARQESASADRCPRYTIGLKSPSKYTSVSFTWHRACITVSDNIPSHDFASRYAHALIDRGLAPPYRYASANT